MYATIGVHIFICIYEHKHAFVWMCQCKCTESAHSNSHLGVFTDTHNRCGKACDFDITLSHGIVSVVVQYVCEPSFPASSSICVYFFLRFSSSCSFRLFATSVGHIYNKLKCANYSLYDSILAIQMARLFMLFCSFQFTHLMQFKCRHKMLLYLTR